MMISITLTLLLAILAVGVPVGITLIIVALVTGEIYSFLPIQVVAAEISWSTSTSYILTAIPLFVLMGELFMRTEIANRMYSALSLWITWLPGGLLHANISASALFAATSGSSVATAATIGTVALPQMERFGYNKPLFLGSIAAGGTLGILIPPSINLIIYGAITQSSIPDLYIAAIIPGMCLAGLFSLIAIVASLIIGRRGKREAARVSWRQRIGSLSNLLPPLIVLAVVIGSIYGGIATPTESAALGVVAVVVLAMLYRSLSAAALVAAISNTVRLTGQIMLIVIGAYILNFALTSIGLINAITNTIQRAGLEPMEVLLLVIAVYLIAGMFLETLSMMVATVPIVAPIMMHAGFDLVWFGVLLMVLMETAMITPPVGINLFVVKGVYPNGRMMDIILGTLPFVIAMLIMVAILVAWPSLALWLPSTLK